jgi:small subunit ribosomal protein S7
METKMKIFNKWETEGVVIEDPGLKQYINLKVVIVPRSGGRYSKKKFWKSKMSIVERLMNKLMTPGHKGKKHLWTSGICVGKSQLDYRIINETFDIIFEKTKQNPIQVLVKAIENSAPREETTTIEHGGIKHPKSVDVSPQRRVDEAIRWLIQGCYGKSSKARNDISKALAGHIIAASKNEKCFATQKKVEAERQAAASR